MNSLSFMKFNPCILPWCESGSGLVKMWGGGLKCVEAWQDLNSGSSKYAGKKTMMHFSDKVWKVPTIVEVAIESCSDCSGLRPENGTVHIAIKERAQIEESERFC